MCRALLSAIASLSVIFLGIIYTNNLLSGLMVRSSAAGTMSYAALASKLAKGEATLAFAYSGSDLEREFRNESGPFADVARSIRHKESIALGDQLIDHKRVGNSFFS